MTHVIHFGDLEEMIPELSPIERVRLAKIKTIEGQTKQGAFVEVIGVHVRQIQGDRIFCWMFPAARYRTSNGEPLEPADQELMIGGWQMAEHIARMIEDRLLNTDTFKIRPGIIDLGDKVPLPGYWSELTDEDMDKIVKEIESEQKRGDDQGTDENI